MLNLIYSEITKEWYDHADVVRIVRPMQQTLYLKHQVLLKDIYSSWDEEQQKDITVMVFDKKSSKPFYELWQKHELE